VESFFKDNWKEAMKREKMSPEEYKIARDKAKKKWRENNNEEARATATRARRKMRALAYAKLGGRCNSPECKWVNSDGTFGCTDVRCLHIDHVNGDGYLEIHESGYQLCKRALNDTEGRYQLLCSNCNWIKRVINGELCLRHRVKKVETK
jgi:hypothetical protein